MPTRSELATELFNSGFNCSQSVAAVFSEKYGLPQSMALNVASGFGGGVRCGEICGAVTGAAMIIGLRFGQNKADDKEAKSKCNAETVEFTNRFRSLNKSVVCRDILGYDISTPEGQEKAKTKNLFSTTCVDMVTSAVRILEDMGY